MDWHLVDAHLDPDPTFHFDADPYPDPDPTPGFTAVGKPIFFLLSVLKYSRKRYLYGSLASNSDGMDTDPDLKALDANPVPARSDRICVRNTDIGSHLHILYSS